MNKKAGFSVCINSRIVWDPLYWTPTQCDCVQTLFRVDIYSKVVNIGLRLTTQRPKSLLKFRNTTKDRVFEKNRGVNNFH